MEAGAYESTYTKAEGEAGAVDLPGTVARVKRRAELQAKRGGRIEVRLYSKKQDGVSEPPLGFRNVRFAVKGTMDRFVFTVK